VLKKGIRRESANKGKFVVDDGEERKEKPPMTHRPVSMK
jgi:hypothetical protein